MKRAAVIDFLGYSVVSHSIRHCIEDIAHDIAETAEPRWFACLNPHSYVIAQNDPIFSDALRGTDWLVPDGAGIVLGSHFLRRAVPERITGSDIFYGLNDHLNRNGGGSVFFLGSTEEILAEIRGRMAKDYPNLRVAGVFSPPFKEEFSQLELDRMIVAINAAKPDVLWVGMTAPRQEKWIFQNRSRLQVKFIGAIGAVFDFYTGRVKRSHPAFQKIGLEWLPRLFQEPRRLWRRMFVSAPIFLWHLFLERFGWRGR